MRVYYDTNTGEIKGYAVVNLNTEVLPESTNTVDVDITRISRTKNYDKIYEYKVNTNNQKLERKSSKTLNAVNLATAKQNKLAKLDAQFAAIEKRINGIFTTYRNYVDSSITIPQEFRKTYNDAQGAYKDALDEKKKITDRINQAERIDQIIDITLPEDDTNDFRCKL